MSTDTPQEQEILESRLDVIDHESRTRRIVWGMVAAVAAAVLVVVGARTFLGGSGGGSDGTVVAPPPPPLFTSTAFGVPFTVDYLPSWTTDAHVVVDKREQSEYVTWGRGGCTGDAGSPTFECVAVAFERYTAVPTRTDTIKGVPVTYASYLTYIDGLAKSGALTITDRSSTTVSGRPAVVFTVRAARDIECGQGINPLGQGCMTFYAWDTGRYAVVDTGSLDTSGGVLVIWTRGHGLGPAEKGWLTQFDQMLTTVTFTGTAPATK